MKIILDSNVIIAAFAGRGLCNSVFELCFDRYDLFISEHIISEVYSNLHKKLNLPKKNADRIFLYLKEFCLVKNYDKLKNRISKNKDDDEISGLAKATKADCIITGDNDLLILDRFDITKIISPRQFWEIAKHNQL